jgi:hypothetical protein
MPIIEPIPDMPNKIPIIIKKAPKPCTS